MAHAFFSLLLSVFCSGVLIIARYPTHAIQFIHRLKWKFFVAQSLYNIGDEYQAEYRLKSKNLEHIFLYQAYGI